MFNLVKLYNFLIFVYKENNIPIHTFDVEINSNLSTHNILNDIIINFISLI